MMKAEQIVQYAKQAARENWGYVLGGQGEVYTKEIAKRWGDIKQGGKGPAYFLNDCARWYGSKVVDCSGLIIEAFRSAMPYYQDQTADTLYTRCSKKGSISALPDIAGICVWKKGHIGIHTGGGELVEARGVDYGVVRSRVSERDFTHWGMLRDAVYTLSGTGGINTGKYTVKRLLKYTTPLMRGDDVRWLQSALNAAGHSSGAADGIFGSKTRSAVMAFQRAGKLAVDGIAGRNTVAALGGVYL